MSQYFKFKGNIYCNNTIVKIYDDKRKRFGFYRYLKFYEYDCNKKKYKFHCIDNCWQSYELSEKELGIYIESIATAYVPAILKEGFDIKPKDIDGIVVAWIWFIFVMFGSLFLKDIIIKLVLQIITLCVFTVWRLNKMKGK
jgi:hypothetical protein